MSKRVVALNERGNVRIGEDHPRAALTDHEVELVLELRESDPEFWTYRRLAERFEVSFNCIAFICRGERRCHIAMRWKTV